LLTPSFKKPGKMTLEKENKQIEKIVKEELNKTKKDNK
jgi:hypothetical protein